MSTTVIPVILSGGSGTRLWPLSRPDRPKQFLPLVTDNSLLQDTVSRLSALDADIAAPVVVCNAAHESLVGDQLDELAVETRTIVLEPEGRNTAPALAVAALLAERSEGRNALLVVLPSDHVIGDRAAFAVAAEHALAAAKDGFLVTFGIVPDRPETGYGYLLKGESRGAWSLLSRFVEKPNAETAAGYIASGEYLWNSGMFVFPVGGLLDEFAVHAPDILNCCERAVEATGAAESAVRLGEAFLASRSDSIDYAVMEKTDKAAVVALNAGWNDVGSWAALYELGSTDDSGNVSRGNVFLDEVENSYVLSSGRRLSVLGVEGLLVVETAEEVLITRLDRAQDVKRAAEAAKAKKP